MICPFPAGGPMDGVARATVEAVRKHLPRPMAVVNRPGGGGSIGSAEIMQAKPDGYTIGIGGFGTYAISPHMTDLPYKGPDDFAYIVGLTTLPVVFAVSGSSPHKTLREFLDASKANPGKLKVATSGTGTNVYLFAHWLKDATKAGFIVAPYTGGGEPIAAVLGGHVDAALETTATVYPMTQAGKMRVLAVFEPNRITAAPDAPTLKELGINVEASAYYFILAPKGMPGAVVSVLENAFRKAAQEEMFLTYVRNTHQQVMTIGGEELLTKLRSDYAVFGRLVEQLGMKKP